MQELLSVSTQPELRYASISNTLDLVLESLSVKRMFKVDFVPGQISKGCLQVLPSSLQALMICAA